MTSEHSIQYNFVRSRQLEGTYPGDQSVGTWGISYNRTLFGWGRIEADRWEVGSTTEDFNTPEPPGLDQIAKHNRIPFYQRIRSASDASAALVQHRALLYPEREASEPRNLLLALSVGFEITQEFVDSPLGVIDPPPIDSPIVGAHAVGLLWDMVDRKRFAFDNSWGPDWGTCGRGSMSYEFFDDAVVEAWCFDVRPAQLLQSESGVKKYEWAVPTLVGDDFRGFEYYDNDTDERIGWAFAALRDNFFDVEELFVRPQYRRKGYGGKLAAQLSRTAAQLGLPLRVWIPFADSYPDNRPALTAILKTLNLAPRRSGVRWAAYQALPAQGRAIRFPPIRIPSRPAYSKEAARDRSDGSLRGKVLSYADPYGPATDPNEWEALR